MSRVKQHEGEKMNIQDLVVSFGVTNNIELNGERDYSLLALHDPFEAQTRAAFAKLLVSFL